MSARSSGAFWIATWFGCGYAPKAPGTAGSLAAIVIAIGSITLDTGADHCFY